MGRGARSVQSTESIPFGTTVQPIYFRQPFDFATSASFIHELSGGRFRFGIGVTHGPVHQRLGVKPGKPLADTRRVVEQLRKASEEGAGGLPPGVAASMRQ